MYLLKIGRRQTLTDPDKILQAYVGRTQISCVKILVPLAKGAQNGGRKCVFLLRYSELAFLFKGQIGMKLNLNRRILKLFPQGGDFAPKLPFSGCFDGSPCDRATGQGLRFST